MTTPSLPPRSTASNASFAAMPPRSARARLAPQPSLGRWGADVKRILCIRPDNLGDVLMSSPAIAALKRAVPGRHITLLASGSGAAAAPFIPEIDDVIHFDPPWAKHDAVADPAPTRELIQRLADNYFDAAVIFTVYSQSPLPAATLCYLAGIPRRLGYCRENPYALLNDWRQECEPETIVRHEVQRQLDLVAEIGATADDACQRRLRFALAATDIAGVEAILRAYRVAPSQGWIVLHPGATAESRRYPASRFAEIAAALVQQTGMTILITGSHGETALAQQVCAAAMAHCPMGESRIVNLAGRLSLGELGVVLDRAALLVANNSGPVHIASACQTPVIDIYAMTNPQHTPWDTPQRVVFQDVPCRWCYKSRCPEVHHRCMTGIDAQTVVEHALDLLQETGANGIQSATRIAPSPPFPRDAHDHVYARN